MQPPTKIRELLELHTHILGQNSVLKTFINCIDSLTHPPLLPSQKNKQKTKKNKKEHLHTKYKDYRNLLPALLIRSKNNYQGLYYNTNWSDIKNTWEDTKFVLSVKENNASGITSI